MSSSYFGSMRIIGIGRPITPVEQTPTSRALEAERLGDGVAHRVGVADALHAGAGVGIAGVGDDGAEVALAQVGLGDADRGGLHAVGGEGAGRTARAVSE